PNQSLASARTFTFCSSVPVGVIALRGFTNERSEFLITTMPVVDLGKTENTTLHIAHFADGGGWRTVINLINPSDVPISGTVSFVGYAAPIAYAIAARSSVQLVSDRSGSADIQTGSIRIIPTAGHIAPASNAVFSFQRNG